MTESTADGTPSDDASTATDGHASNRVLDWFLRGLGMPDESDLDTRDGEGIRHCETANRTQNRRRAVGGRLWVTDRRVAFRPHDFDDGLAGAARDLALEDVVDVGTEAPYRNPLRLLRHPLDALFGGGLRTRLRVESADGTTDLFVVSDPEETVAAVEGAVAER